jgi:hypothetical protein
MAVLESNQSASHEKQDGYEIKKIEERRSITEFKR